MVLYIATDLFEHEATKQDENENQEEYVYMHKAPNLWSLTIEAVEAYTTFGRNYLHSMLIASPNLYHLCIDIDVYISDKTIILPTNNLLSLTFGAEVMFDDCADIISKCHNLRYLAFPWIIQDQEQDDYNFDLYKILRSYIDNMSMDKKYFIGITQDSDGFEDSVAELLDDNNENEETNIIAVFEEFKKILIDRYHCDDNKFINFEILLDDQLTDDTKDYAQRLTQHTFGLTQSKCINVRPENISNWVVNRVLNKKNEFAIFMNDISNTSVIDDLSEENIVL